MEDNNGIIKYIEEMIPNEYYIIIIIEDLMRYFNFQTIEDKIFSDVRTVTLKNNNSVTIMINSKIISYLGEKYSQYNKITYKSNSINCVWEYIGKCYKKKL